MLRQIKKLFENGMLLELANNFTENDAELIKKKFEENLNADCKYINLLIKIENGAPSSLIKFKAFLEGALWEFKYCDKIDRCAIVTNFDLISSLIKIESMVLSLKEAAFEEKYFEQDQLDEAMEFLKPQPDSSGRQM